MIVIFVFAIVGMFGMFADFQNRIQKQIKQDSNKVLNYNPKVVIITDPQTNQEYLVNVNGGICPRIK